MGTAATRKRKRRRSGSRLGSGSRSGSGSGSGSGLGKRRKRAKTKAKEEEDEEEEAGREGVTESGKGRHGGGNAVTGGETGTGAPPAGTESGSGSGSSSLAEFRSRAKGGHGDSRQSGGRGVADAGADVGSGGGGGGSGGMLSAGGKQLSLLEETVHLRRAGKLKELTKEELEAEEERKLVEAFASTKALVSAAELAEGGRTVQPLPTTWRPPRWAQERGPEVYEALRTKYNIEIKGEDVPKCLTTFEAMKLPPAIVKHLVGKSILKPTPIQMQGLPTILSGRDMIGISYTGSGKTLVFTLPLVLVALEEELRMPLMPGEGPVGVVLSPSRELARQTHQIACDLAAALHADGGPKLRMALCMGGVPVKPALEMVDEGVHAVVATPGRLLDMLKKEQFSLRLVRYMCLDEADRLISDGFEEDMRDILSFTGKAPRQTVLFSATMAQSIKEFGATALVSPVVVTVGRAGAASLDIIIEVEYVATEEEKMSYVVNSVLDKTEPPVIVFSSSSSVVDALLEYMMIKGVAATAIHGGLSQSERLQAMDDFKNGKADVLIASDVAAKGIDFPHIAHVICVDLPKEFEMLPHRLGRTGRAGNVGVASVLITPRDDPIMLSDLRAMLIEAKQRVPPYLLRDATASASATEACPMCGGLGHRIADCPLVTQRARTNARSRMRRGDEHRVGDY
ncbi:zinc finger protein [Thecamonas trahens ATCC 50062]|uniref:RNA helicase n=1 Tax=Thecamonas trahens ATCC 50062 TaxID=461836 RepID=A0A0L0DN26_THETB|nr:zinc finger protein [Thecamonas trahens ATCC 50062]KNC52818.1 zinc finger protein [Thecamonas trahens ATCC 50062]|eukprot:XP_013754924.1 zinc finger protein [Thecamonas trahens ATCC 50062]